MSTDGFSVRAAPDGMADGLLVRVELVGVEVDDCEDFASTSFLASSAPHPHATSTTQADAATLTSWGTTPYSPVVRYGCD